MGAYAEEHPMNTKHGTGYRPVPAGVREDPWHLHPMARLGASPDADLTPFAPPVDDQDGVGQCTGQAVICGAFTALGKAGTPLAQYPNPQTAYRMALCLARSYEWSSGNPPSLQDTGTDPNLVYLGLNKWGCASAKDVLGFADPCPELTAAYAQHACDEPTLGEFEFSDNMKLVGQQVVTSSGQQRILDVRAALAAGFPFTMSVYASDARFQGYTGGVMPAAPDGSECDHLVCALKSTTLATGETVFLVQNSWSKGWGMGGFFLASSGILLQSDGVHVCSLRKAA